MYPYYPSPLQLWGEYYEGERKDKEAPSKGRKRVVELSEEELSEEEEEEEYVPAPKKRGAPKPR